MAPRIFKSFLISVGMAAFVIWRSSLGIYGTATWNKGDIFAGMGDGLYTIYDSVTLLPKDTLQDPDNGDFVAGCAFTDDYKLLYTTAFNKNHVVVYEDAVPHTQVQDFNTTAPDTTAYNESISFAADKTYFVSHAGDGTVGGTAANLYHYKPGTLPTDLPTLLQTYDTEEEVGGFAGTDWIDLAADQKTIFYTSEGRRIFKYDTTGTGTQLSDFTVLANDGGRAFALRLLPPGDGSGGLLIADSLRIKRLDGSGAVIKTYDVAAGDPLPGGGTAPVDENDWFSLNRDPDGTSFWSGDQMTGHIFKFDIATGALLAGPIVTGAAPGHLAGICIRGELVIPPTPCPDGTFTWKIDGNGDLVIVYDQFPAPNDNSYGVNAVGWPHGHSFKALVNSDKAGIQLKDQNGIVRLSFTIDTLTATSGTPSGYASRGPFGGDGGVLVGTLTPADISWDTAIARNLNNTGYFVGGVQVIGTSGTNSTMLLTDSPPTMDTINNYTLRTPNPWNGVYVNPENGVTVNGWNFRNTFFATITAAKLASLGFDESTWTVTPNETVLHNSPAKPCPVVEGGCNMAVTQKAVATKEVRITLKNNGTTDDFLTALNVTWPATNGKLRQVKLGGDVIYDNPDIAPPTANLTLAQLVADQNKRKIQKGTSEVLKLVFEYNASVNFGLYSGTVSFGDDCVITILP